MRTSVVAVPDDGRLCYRDEAGGDGSLCPRHDGQAEPVVCQQDMLNLHAHAFTVVHHAHLGRVVYNRVGDAATAECGGNEVQEADTARMCGVGNGSRVVHITCASPASMPVSRYIQLNG